MPAGMTPLAFLMESDFSVLRTKYAEKIAKIIAKITSVFINNIITYFTATGNLMDLPNRQAAKGQTSGFQHKMYLLNKP